MSEMRRRWLFTALLFVGLTSSTTAIAQSAPPQPDANAASATTQQDPARTKTSPKSISPREVKNPERPSLSLIPPAVVAGVGITGFFVSAIIYEYAGGLIDGVRNCYGDTCPEDRALLERAREYRSGTIGGMVTSGLVFGVGLIWFAILAPNANSYTPPRAYVLPVVTPKGVFLTGAF